MRKVYLLGFRLALSLLVDALIFAIWLITHPLLFKLITLANFSGISLMVFNFLESLFAIATIIPITLFLYTEILYAIKELEENNPRNKKRAT